MTETMYIGSGDVAALMAGKNTKAHISLMQRFVSGVKPHYNAKASPIDALRTGSILEDRYLASLPMWFIPQYVVYSDEMDVFKASLDFAEIKDGKLFDFRELKTLYLNDYVDNIQPIKGDNEKLVAYVKKSHKKYYEQVQEQLYCTRLDSCYMVFLCVNNYDDEINYHRVITDDDVTLIRIHRDERVISKIKERGVIFQQIKDCYDIQPRQSA
ncbi:hypothetical protein [Bacteroides neonati]|uniref:hypothetical protein n=1 Tax=Bacteroides neonati TaxID=1347393 RepID=UPI0005A6F173|nr:hypothetical protein [Bacteroides neonati]